LGGSGENHEKRQQYLLLDSQSGDVLARYDLIDQALAEAQRRNRKRWR
jgi:hypothetical protein